MICGIIVQFSFRNSITLQFCRSALTLCVAALRCRSALQLCIAALRCRFVNVSVYSKISIMIVFVLKRNAVRVLASVPSCWQNYCFIAPASRVCVVDCLMAFSIESEPINEMALWSEALC